MARFNEQDRTLLYVVRSTARQLERGSWADCVAIYNRLASRPRTQDGLCNTYRSLNEAEIESRSRAAEWEAIREQVKEWLHDGRGSRRRQSSEHCHEAETGEVACPAPVQTQQFPLMQWELSAQTDLAIDTALFPQQESAWWDGCLEAADVLDSNAALWSTERAGDPFAGATTTALEHAAMCGMSSAAMNGMSSAGIYRFSNTVMNTVENMPTVMFHGTPADTYSAPANIQSTSMCIDLPFGMLQGPGSIFADTLGLSDSTAVSLSNNTATSSSSWSTANGSISNEPLHSLDFPSLSAESVGVMNTLSGDNVHGLMSSEELCSLLRDCEAGFDAT